MINFIQLDSTDDKRHEEVIALRMSGKLTKDDLTKVNEAIETRVDSGHKPRVYVEVETMDGVETNALGDALKQAFNQVKDSLFDDQKVEKKAIVYDKGWAEDVTKLGDKIAPSTDARHFRWSERDQARAWILQ